MAEKRYVARFEARDQVSGPVKMMTQTLTQAGKETTSLARYMKDAERDQKMFSRSSREVDSSVSRMKSSLVGAGTAFNSFSSAGLRATKGILGGVSRLTGMLTSLPSLIAGAGAAFGLWKLGDAVIGGAMSKELTQMQMGALLADKSKGKELFSVVQDKAMTSMFSEKDFAAAATTFLPVTKDFDEIARMMDVNERLAASNPLEGMEGASFSMREALSGDIASIADRFNISKKTLRESGFDSGASWQQNLNAVDKTLDKMGYTAAYVADVNDSAYAQWELFKSNSLKLFADSGEGILSKLKDPLKQLNATLGSQQVSRFVSEMGDGMANMFQRSLDYVNNLDVSWSGVEKWAKETWSGASAMMESAWGAGKELVDLIAGEDDASLASAFANLGKSMEGIAHGIDTIAKAFDTIDRGGTWLSELASSSGKKVGEWIGLKGEPFKYEGGYNSLLKQWGPLTDAELWNEGKKTIKNSFGFDPLVENRGRLRGSHRAGLSYVPYDGYVAELHKGEKVLTKQEAQGKSPTGFSITIQQMNVRRESDIQEIGKAIVSELRLKGAF